MSRAPLLGNRAREATPSAGALDASAMSLSRKNPAAFRSLLRGIVSFPSTSDITSDVTLVRLLSVLKISTAAIACDRARFRECTAKLLDGERSPLLETRRRTFHRRNFFFPFLFTCPRSRVRFGRARKNTPRRSPSYDEQVVAVKLTSGTSVRSFRNDAPNGRTWWCV